jgi:hypothetical protein
MMIIFTVQQVNELLQALGNIPYVYSKPLIDGINQIIQTQIDVAKKQQSDEVKEPDISLS